MASLPDLNSTCYYTFTTEFQTLNGIYTLNELMTYNEAITTGVNFVTSFYTPAGLTAANFTTDQPTYVNDTILYLTPADSTSGVALYAPSLTLAAIPDPMIGCYNNVALGVSLGLFSDPTTLTWIINELNSIISATVGVSNPVKLYSLGVQHMRVADYNALVATRQAAKSAYTTLYEQLQAEIAIRTAAQTLNQYYQATLIALQ